MPNAGDYNKQAKVKSFANKGDVANILKRYRTESSDFDIYNHSKRAVLFHEDVKNATNIYKIKKNTTVTKKTRNRTHFVGEVQFHGDWLKTSQPSHG